MDRKMKRGGLGTMRQGSNVLLATGMFNGARQGPLSIRLRFLLPVIFILAPRQQQKHGNLSATPKKSLNTDWKLEQLAHFMQGDEPTTSSNSAQVREKE